MENVPALLAAIRGGDTNSKQRLFELYRPYLRRIVLQKPIVRGDASDLVQEACLMASASLDKFIGGTEPELTAWLRTILLNAVRQSNRANMAARRDIRREKSMKPDDSAAVHWGEFVDDAPSPSSTAIRGEAALYLVAAIDRLPPDQAMAVEMRYLHQMSFKDIAEQMDRTIGAVAGLVRRAIDTLKIELPDILDSI